MNRSTITRIIGIVAFAIAVSLTAAHAAEPKTLSKSQAAQLLTSMGYKDIEVGAVIHGFAPMTGSQNVATVLAIARRMGEVEKLETSFLYDADIGWFYYEYDDSGTKGLNYNPPTKLRMWTLSGYKEFRPKSSE